MAQTRADLDKAGCGMAMCHHDHSVLYLHSRCHIKAGVLAHFHPDAGTVMLQCAECKKRVSEISVLSPFVPVELRCSKCHPSYGLDISYTKRTGILDAVCKRCKEPVRSIVVSPGPSTGMVQ
jgi:ribosomal protein L31